MALHPSWGCDRVYWGQGAATWVGQSWVLLEQTRIKLTCRLRSCISFVVQSEEVYSCGGWLPWRLQKYSGEYFLCLIYGAVHAISQIFPSVHSPICKINPKPAVLMSR